LLGGFFYLFTVSTPPGDILGDINRDGMLDGADWTQFVASMHADLSGLDPNAQFAMGDLDGDGYNNYVDPQLFTTYYKDAHGLGAFEAMVASVPEPGSLLLLAVGVVAWWGWRRIKTGSTHQDRSYPIATC
jgi:hypothetical protein